MFPIIMQTRRYNKHQYTLLCYHDFVIIKTMFGEVSWHFSSQSVLSSTKSYSLLVFGPVPFSWTRTACMTPPATMRRDPGERAHRNRTHIAGPRHGALLIRDVSITCHKSMFAVRYKSFTRYSMGCLCIVCSLSGDRQIYVEITFLSIGC